MVKHQWVIFNCQTDQSRMSSIGSPAPLSVEDTFPMAYVDARTTKKYFHTLFLVIPFLASHKKILRTSRRNGYSYEKGSLGKDIPSFGSLVGLLLALT
jgi:hypothetical protein